MKINKCISISIKCDYNINLLLDYYSYFNTSSLIEYLIESKIKELNLNNKESK